MGLIERSKAQWTIHHGEHGITVGGSPIDYGAAIDVVMKDEADALRDQLRGAVRRAETAEAEVKRLTGVLEAQGRSWKRKLAAAERRLRAVGGQ